MKPIHECSPRCQGCRAEIDDLRLRVGVLEEWRDAHIERSAPDFEPSEIETIEAKRYVKQRWETVLVQAKKEKNE